MEFLKKFKEKLGYDLSQIELSNLHRRSSFDGELLHISAIERLLDEPEEMVFLTKNGFIISLVKYYEDSYNVTIYFNPTKLDEVKFYINGLNKKNK